MRGRRREELAGEEVAAKKAPGVDPSVGGIQEEGEEDPVSDVSDDEGEDVEEADTPRPLVHPKSCLALSTSHRSSGRPPGEQRAGECECEEEES